MGKRSTAPAPRPAWQTDKYRASLHRAIYLATGDKRYRHATRPGDDIRFIFKGFARSLVAQMKAGLEPSPAG